MAMVRVSAATHARATEVARSEGRTLGEVIAAAVDAYARDRFFAEVNAGFERLRTDPAAWADYQAELAQWDQTLADGLVAESWDDERS